MKTSPPYRCPKTFHELGASVPRLVNARWLIQALRDNARAIDRGAFLPWRPEELDRRAAGVLELHIKRGDIL